MTRGDDTAPLYGFGLDGPSVEVLDRRQRCVVVAAVGVLLAGAVWAPVVLATAVVGACAAVLVLVNAFRTWTVVTAARHLAPADPPAVADDHLPPYTLLVPLYGEANVVAGLVRHLGALDYPPDRLQVLLLCEADDPATVEAVDRLGLADPFRLVICPDGSPRTKPRACNVGLRQATGDLCVVYDAEDRPEPDQLRRAAARFAAAAPAVACLQARLAFDDADRNWLARCSGLEYAIIFGLVLPGLAAMDLPVPLGGTSNHFRVHHLRELGGWDPHNVTEDADLGLRIHRAGLRTAMLDSTTFEEPCARLWPWIRQRTRWMKGYLLTWLVHSRPAPAGPGLDGRARLVLHLYIGGVPAAAVSLPLAAAVLAVLGTSAPPPVLVLGAVALGSSVAMHVVTAALARRPRWRLWQAVPSMIGFSVLVAVATGRALWQLGRRPHHWEKTPHGLFGAVGP